MYWKYGTTRVKSPTLTFVALGDDYEFSLTLVTEAGEDLSGCYLSVPNTDHVGLLSAKISTGSTYMPVLGLFDASCYLGDIPGGSEIEVDFLVSFGMSGPTGQVNIPIVLGHDDGAPRPNVLWQNEWPELWIDEWPSEMWEDVWPS